MVKRLATCRTVDCSNYGIPVEVVSDLNSMIICGVCSQSIRDVVNDYDDGEVEVPPWLI